MKEFCLRQLRRFVIVVSGLLAAAGFLLLLPIYLSTGLGSLGEWGERVDRLARLVWKHLKSGELSE
ncbi:MAG: hypothetical protein AAF628_08405 [Planctomycetota bacterium]